MEAVYSSSQSCGLRCAPPRTGLCSTASQARSSARLVDVAIWVLLVSGAIISVDRLTSSHSTPTYGVVLALKIAFSIWMFGLVWFRRRGSSTMPPEEAARNLGLARRISSVLTPTNLILALGLLVLLLAELLGQLFEQSIAG